MKYDIEKLAQVVESAIKRRSKHEPLWQDCLDFAQPDSEHFFSEREGQETMEDVFDPTAIDATEEFVSMMSDGATPRDASYFNLEPGVETEEDEDDTLKEQLDNINEIVTDVIGNSNFNGQAQQNWEDLAVSHCAMYIDEGDMLNPINCQAVPSTEVYFIPGPYGNIGGIIRKRKIKNKDLLAIYPEFDTTDDLKRDITARPEDEKDYTEVTYRDFSFIEDEKNYYVIYSDKDKHIGIEKELVGRGSNPWIWSRWRPRANEPYGRGPLVKALPAIRLVNLVQQLLIENAEMSISGIWDYQDDGTINADTIELIPGTIIPRGMNSEGLRNVVNNSNFNLAELVIEKLQQSIRRAMYNEDLGPVDTTPMSATEVNARIMRLARRIGPAYNRIWEEYITAFIYRVLYILKKRGTIKVPKIDGKVVKLIPRSPIAKAQRMQTVIDMDEYVMRIRNVFGDEVAFKQLKIGEHIKKTAALAEYPIDIVDQDADLGIPGSPNIGLTDILDQAGGIEGLQSLLGGGAPPQ